MPRRGDPELIYEARRAGLLMRLVQSEQVDELVAGRWLSAWERHAASFGPARGSRAYWEVAWEWIAYERTLKQQP